MKWLLLCLFDIVCFVFSSSNNNQIDILHYHSSLSYEIFNNNYRNKFPVILKGFISNETRKYWTIEEFVERLGNYSVNVMLSNYPTVVFI